MSKLTVYNTNDSRFALVEWVSKKDYAEYSVISMNDVEILPNDQVEYELELVYKARFAGIKYKAKILYIGSKEECDKKESDIISTINEQIDTLKSRVSKSSSAKVVNVLTNSNRDECRLKLLESQVNDLQQVLEEKKKKKRTLEISLKEFKESSVHTNQENDKQLVEKLINHAAYVFSIFGTKNDLAKIAISSTKENNDKTVLISSNYDFRMPKALKQQLNALSLNVKTSDTMLYRDLIKGVITDSNILANANADFLIKNNSIVLACKEFVLELRPSFTDANMKKCLRELCCEARQSIWKRDEDKVFVVEGKEYKRQDSNNETSATQAKQQAEKVKRAGEEIMSNQNKRPKSTDYTKTSNQNILNDISIKTTSNNTSAAALTSNTSVLSQLTSTKNLPTATANFADNFIDYSFKNSSGVSLTETNNIISNVISNFYDDDDTHDF